MVTQINNSLGSLGSFQRIFSLIHNVVSFTKISVRNSNYLSCAPTNRYKQPPVFDKKNSRVPSFHARISAIICRIPVRKKPISNGRETHWKRLSNKCVKRTRKAKHGIRDGKCERSFFDGTSGRKTRWFFGSFFRDDFPLISL